RRAGAPGRPGVSALTPARTIHRFPQGFLWGASTSSHQVEGNNVWNDWWASEQAGELPYRSGQACRHYELFEHDFDLARSLGQNAHRLSIEWSRIEPAEGAWSEEAIAHYANVMDALRARNLEPIVTLHHFTNPAWFSRRGGWTRRDSPRLFARYVARVVQTLGSRVKYWLTINEPTVYVVQGWVLGEWPPFSKSAWGTATRVFVNLARAHRAAYREIHRGWPDAMVGFAHSGQLIAACDPARISDRLAARLRDLLLNHGFFSLIGGRGGLRSPALDFIGLNYYYRTIVQSAGSGLQRLIGRTCDAPHHDRGPISDMGWEVHPAGLTSMLRKYARYGLPILITENGIATEDEKLRRDFIASHLRSLATAVADGVNVFGYCYWSLIDNFEWAHGTRPRFGLAAVDYDTQQRVPRPGAAYFAEVCRTNRLAESEGADAFS
ncbi:MAG TPA: glycoside hydrolase family 1 protein, partial [Vicinamibacterales bacterium]